MDLRELLKAKHLLISAVGNEHRKVNGSLISLRGHKPGGLVEHKTHHITISTESVCFHHSQLTPLIAGEKRIKFLNENIEYLQL